MSAISRSWKRAILKLLTYEHCLKMLLLHSNRDLGWTCTKQRGNDVYLLHIARTQAGKTRRIRGRYRRGTFPRRRPRQRPRHHQPPRAEIEPGNGRNRHLGRMRPHRLLLQSRGHLHKLQRSLDASLRHTLAQRSKQLGERGHGVRRLAFFLHPFAPQHSVWYRKLSQLVSGIATKVLLYYQKLTFR